MLRVVLLSVLCAVVFSQVPKCESPKQWQAQYLMVDPSKVYESFGNMTYDETGQRMNLMEAEDVQEKRERVRDLYLYKTGMHYRENLETQACVKSAIGVPFRPIGVPPNAEFRGYAYIGSSQNDHAGIKVQNWYNHSDTATLFAAFTAVACVPVQDSYYSQNSGFVHTSLFNVQEKIDTSAFDIPKGCQ